MAAMDKLVKLMQLQKMMDDSDYRKQKYAYDMGQDKILKDSRDRTYNLQKETNERAKVAAEQKAAKDAAEKQFRGVYNTNTGPLLEAYKGDKAGFVDEILAIGADYPEGAPKDLGKTATNLYKNTYGTPFELPTPTRQSQYVLSEYVAATGRPPKSNEEWAEAERMAFTDDSERGPWMDRMQDFSNASIGGQMKVLGKDPETGNIIMQDVHSGNMFTQVSPGKIVPVTDEPLPESAQTALTGTLKGIDLINKMIALAPEVSTDIAGWNIIKGMGQKAKLWAGGGTEAEQKYQAAYDSLINTAQETIKGTPSNFDIENFKKTIPDFKVGKDFKLEKLKLAKDILAQEYHNQIAYYKGTNKPVPDRILAAAYQLGIDPNEVLPNEDPWDEDFIDTITEDQWTELYRAHPDIKPEDEDAIARQMFGGK